jgi:hypothetical protein
MAAVSIDLWQTRYLETMRTYLRNSFIALMATWDTMKGDVVDGCVFGEMDGWVANAKERVIDTLLNLKVFVDLREAKFSVEHEAAATGH